MASVDVEHHVYLHPIRVQELCKGRGGRSGLPSLIVPMASVDVEHHVYLHPIRAQELCKGRGGRSGLPSLIVLTVSVDVVVQLARFL